MNNHIAGFISQPQGAISNPAFKGTIIETFTWPGNETYFFNFLIQRAVLIFIIIGVLYFFFNFVLGAIAWINSSGDKQALETARSRIQNALIGIVVLFSVFAVLKFLEDFLGINILTLDIVPFAI